jgi:SET domain-containing protein
MITRLFIKEVKGKGRGVFSSMLIAKDEVIEECPLVVIPAEDYDIITSTRIVNFCFFFDREEKILALAMGFGSMYNHAFPSNASHSIDRDTRLVTIYAVRAIAAGEEICINYNGDHENDSLEWFVSRNITYRS